MPRVMRLPIWRSMSQQDLALQTRSLFILFLERSQLTIATLFISGWKCCHASRRQRLKNIILYLFVAWTSHEESITVNFYSFAAKFIWQKLCCYHSKIGLFITSRSMIQLVNCHHNTLRDRTGLFAYGQFIRGQFTQISPPKVRLI